VVDDRHRLAIPAVALPRVRLGDWQGGARAAVLTIWPSPTLYCRDYLCVAENENGVDAGVDVTGCPVFPTAAWQVDRAFVRRQMIGLDAPRSTWRSLPWYAGLFSCS